MNTALIILVPFSVTWFGVFLRRAIELHGVTAYRHMFGVLFIALLPICITSIIWAHQGEGATLIKLIVLGFLGACVGATTFVWIGLTISSGGADNAAVARRSTLDGTIKFECVNAIFRPPADGNMLELIASDDNARSLIFQKHWLSTHAYQTNPSIIPTKYGMIDKCRITNFGSVPVFNIRIAAEAIFTEQIPIAEKTFEQKEIDRKTTQFYIDQVHPGESGSVEILVWNTTKFIVTLIFNSDAELQKLGDAERESVKLIPAHRMVALFPSSP
jgi:hypothetical protein